MRTRRNLPGLLVDFPTVVNNLFNDDLFNPHTTASAVRKPAVNIVEDQDSYGLAFMVPGFEKNDFKIKIENNTLTVAAEHTSTEETSQNHYTHQEFALSSFKRVFNLPENEIDETQIRANYENGILKIVLPKKEEVKPKAPLEIVIH